MKKAKKLVLSRETLRPLESHVTGAAIQPVALSDGAYQCPMTGPSCCCTMGCSVELCTTLG
ncbi:MAG TPA: hypothetical protein VEL74_05110 [Thermoanaerobaculia bacterium]|nr:hypothetical protein [Thermoanaerobaculia bacterium]